MKAEGADLHGGRGYSRAARDFGAGVYGDQACECAYDSQGASEINMSFMIEESDAEEAVRSLHAHFFKDPDPAVFDVEARAAVVAQ